jgi:ornithine cyclodeaminase/alanine dehydrogenase-like protein (mu-crystallin family)
MEMPPKLIFSDPGNNGDFRVMPCVIQDHDIRIKTVKLVGTNVRQRRVTDQITVGKAFLVDDAENFISHVFEACLLSSARTAICACLAMELLCGRGATLTVVGAGRVGYYTAFYALALGFAETVVISDIDENRARRTVTALKSRYPGVSISSSDYMSLRHTDVLALATTSVKPVYHPDHFRAGLVISMGADVDYQHELDPAIARISRLFVDTKDCLNYGDLKAWLENGLIAADTITDIFSLLNNYEPDNESIPAVFISTGSGVFDNLTISYLVSESGR